MNFEKKTSEDLRTTLLAELLVLELLSKILYTYPDQKFLQQLYGNDLFQEIPFAGAQGSTVAGLKLLRSWDEGNRNQLGFSILDDLRADYTRLFHNTKGLPISPWESVYFGKERSLFEKSTLDVRNWYRRFGLRIENQGHEPDDHIGLELAFVSQLARLALVAMEEDDQAKFQNILEAKRRFLVEHPLKWVPLWAMQMQEYGKTDFYRGIALVTKGVLLELAAILELDVPGEV